MKRTVFFALTLIAIPSTVLSAGSPKQQASAARIAVQVLPFQVREGVDLPGEYLEAITNDLVTQLTACKKFTQVLRPADRPDGDTPLVQLTGTVVHFRKGSRAARAIVGGFAGGLIGRTQINAHIEFTDATTRQVKIERDVVGVMAGAWVGGGKSAKVTQELAKQVVKAARKSL